MKCVLHVAFVVQCFVVVSSVHTSKIGGTI